MHGPGCRLHGKRPTRPAQDEVSGEPARGPGQGGSGPETGAPPEAPVPELPHERRPRAGRVRPEELAAADDPSKAMKDSMVQILQQQQQKKQLL